MSVIFSECNIRPTVDAQTGCHQRPAGLLKAPDGLVQSRLGSLGVANARVERLVQTLPQPAFVPALKWRGDGAQGGKSFANSLARACSSLSIEA